MTIIVAESITAVESTRLEQLEQIIDRGKQTFIDVGTALGEIRDSRLYRAEHATFEDYCRERWGFSASRGRQLISGAAKALEIATVTGVTPSSEGEVRRLTSSSRPTTRIERLALVNDHLRHELNRVLPAPDPELVERIAAAGRCLHPIVTFEGLILDGWTRYLASRLGGFIPATMTIEHHLLPDINRHRRESPLDLEDIDAAECARSVFYSLNCLRKHLTPDELYIVMSYLEPSG